MTWYPPNVKRCFYCNKVKDRDDFFSLKNRDDSRGICENCEKLTRENNELLKQKRKDARHFHYELHKEEIAEYGVRYRESHKEVVGEKNKKWAKENPKKVKAIQKKWYEKKENKEKINQRRKEKRDAWTEEERAEVNKRRREKRDLEKNKNLNQ